MAANVTGATGSVGPRSLCITSTGRLWQLTGSGTTLQLWYSDDSGASWTRNTSADITSALPGHADLFIDADDHAHVAYTNDTANGIAYRRMASIGAGTSWSAPVSLHSGADLGLARIVAHREGTGWVAHVVYTVGQLGPVYSTFYNRVTITSGGTLTPLAGVGSDLGNGSASSSTTIGIDFHHTQADITAVQSSTPHLYVAWHSDVTTRRLYFRKATYSAGTWTWGTGVELAASISAAGDIFFDGTRVVIPVQTSASTPTVTVYERDSGDTTTTTRTMTGMTVVRPRATYNTATQDVFVVGENAAGNSVDYKQYTRATDTWGSQTTIEAEAVTNNTVTVRRGGLFVVDASWDGASSIRNERTSIPSPPTAATWVNTDNAAADVGASLVLDWTFVDPLPGDTQGSYAVRRQIGSGTLYYWRASDSSWQTTETQNTSATTALTLASSWGADGDANHKYAVKTWDATGSEGVYNTELTVIPSVPSNPTLTTPAAAGSVTSATLTAAWTVTDQDTYRVELLSAADVSLYDSGWMTSSARAKVVSYSLVSGVSYKCRLTTTNSEGLAAASVTHSFTCTYTPPATPTVVVTANSALGKITVAHTNPTPDIIGVLVSGGHTLLTSGGDTVIAGTETPPVTSADVFVRCASGTYSVGERPVGGVGIRVATGVVPGADWIDWAAPSGRAMEYLVRVWAADNTYTDSAWTA